MSSLDNGSTVSRKTDNISPKKEVDVFLKNMHTVNPPPPTAVLGVIYNLQNPYLGLENARWYCKGGGIGGGGGGGATELYTGILAWS